MKSKFLKFFAFFIETFVISEMKIVFFLLVVFPESVLLGWRCRCNTAGQLTLGILQIPYIQPQEKGLACMT